MKRFSVIRLTLLIMAVALLAKPAVSGEEDNEARLQFEEGIRLFKDGDFEGASIAFNRAYELRPSYKILYNVGQVENELKHYCLALAAYTEYLETGGEAISIDRKAEVAGHLEKLKIRVGSVEIRYNRDGTTLLIDEQRQGVTPLETPICVDMGNHDLSLREGVKEIYRESFRIAGGQTLTLNLDAQKTAPAAASPPANDATETVKAPPPAESAKPIEKPILSSTEQESAATDTPATKSRKWTWISLGIGGALGLTGGIVGGISRAKESGLKNRCDNYLCDSDEQDAKNTIKRMNLTADILFGTAGAAAIAGIVLFFIEPKRAEAPNVSVAPNAGRDHAGFSIEGRF